MSQKKPENLLRPSSQQPILRPSSQQHSMQGEHSSKLPVQQVHVRRSLNLEDWVWTERYYDYEDKIWKLFCDIHDLPHETPREIVAPDLRFGNTAKLCWVTDLCDILRREADGRLIIRRKTRLLKI